MTERRQPLKTVRVRITAIATAIVAAALTLAAVGLVTAVHHQLIDKIEAEGRARALMVADRLAAGTPAPDALNGVAITNGPLVVVDQRGNVIAGAAPGIAGSVSLDATTLGGEGGGTQVFVQNPGLQGETPFDIRYQAVDTSFGPVTVLAASPLTDVEHSISTLKSTLVVGVPLLVALVALVAWTIVGRALQPVEAIRAEVEAITASTIHRRVPEPPTDDEVNHLARTMNAMLDRLETASNTQRQFVSDASHELRSPIAAIRTQLEVARRSPSADWPAVADNVLAEEGRLEQLVANLLLLASADEHGPHDDLGTVDLLDIVRSEAARARAVPVSVVASDETFNVRATAAELTTLAANLLDNAARFAREAVVVSVTRSGDNVELVVDDDGPGVPLASRVRVFERFARGDEARTRAQGGAGLGLAVVKTIVERHGGRVEITDSPSGGARLVVALH